MHLLHKNGKKSSLFNRAKISLFETQSPYFKTQISLFGPKKISHVCPTQGTSCETSQVVLAGVPGVFSRGSPVFAPPTDWPISYELK